MTAYIQTSNRIIYETLPEFHWLSPSNKIALTEENRKSELWEYLNIDEFLEKKLEEINKSRIDANNGTFNFSGKAISCSNDGRTNIDAINGIVSLTGAMPNDWVGVWKAEDNSYISIPDVATWTSFYGAMVAQGIANFTQSETLKAQLNAAYNANDMQAMKDLEWT